MSKKNELNIENKIMDKILSGKVNMKPKWFFVAGSILSFASLVGLIMGSIFLINLTIFLIKKQGPGTGRIIQMFQTFPIWIPFLAILLMIIGIWMLKKYDFSYKKNFLMIIAIIVFAALLAGMIFNSLGLNERWSKRGPLRRLYNVDGESRIGGHYPRIYRD